MDLKTEQSLKSYSRSAEKYDSGIPARLKWYGNTIEQIALLHEAIADLIPPNVTSVLDVGCGTGQLAKIIMEKRPDIVYQGFDIVLKNVEDARRLNPYANIFIGNYWEVLNRPFSWDFVVSCGVLFSTTDQKYVPLLFDLLDSVSQKGFIVMCFAGSWGISTPLLEQKMKEIFETSGKISKYYFKGKRDFLPKLAGGNRIFYLCREGTKAKKPKIPAFLISPPEGLL